jgi:non-ribosomal peptide synthetase component F
MKSATDLMSELLRRGIGLTIEGGNLKVRAPKGSVTPELLEQVSLNKPELLRLMQRIPTLRRRDNGARPCLSFAQQRLWFLHQLVPDNPFYNVPVPLRLSGKFSDGALQACLNALVARHETLRTTFSTDGETAVQVIAPPGPVRLPIVDLAALPQSNREAEARRLVEEEAWRPFDLSTGPLFRALLLRLSAEDHVLQLTLHHIISDGWSIPVLVRDLEALYLASCTGEAPRLPPLAIQYADFSVWQRQWLTGSVLSEQLDHWRQGLEGISQLQLPTDRPRPAVPTFAGARENLNLSPELSAALRALSRREGATLYMVLLAAFNVLLQRYTGRDDLVVGSPIANRTRAELEDLIGFFVNNLVMRTDLSGDPSFTELLGRVRQVALDAYAHQDLPFERLVEALEPERDLSRNPLFQVMFAVQNAPGKARPLAGTGLTIDRFPIEERTTRVDLEVYVRGAAEHLRVNFIYSTDLFEAETIARMLGHYERVLEAVVANPRRRLSELPLVSIGERHQLLFEWNETDAAYPADALIHELFEEQVERSPDSVALVLEGQALTYRQLNSRVNRLARYLLESGVSPETLVGVCMERGIDLIASILAIFKAGAVYVPLDPDYPESRLRFMLEDSGVTLVLTHRRLMDPLSDYQGRVIHVDSDWSTIASENAENLGSRAMAESPAYVIYTSGSTGKPKGTVLAHRGLCNVSMEQQRLFGVGSGSRVLQFSSPNFDASLFEIVMALASGATLVLAGKDELQPGPPLSRLLREQRITILTIPPSSLAYWNRSPSRI